MADALTQPFIDRRQAGVMLAQQLRHYAYGPGVIVLGLPRGGVPVGYEVATVLGVPLDVFLVRKLGVPGRPELAMGAVASGGVRMLNADVIRLFDVSDRTVDVVAEAEAQALERREEHYRANLPLLNLAGRTVILVDDGMETGFSMKAAVQGVKARGAARIVVAAPVGPPDVCQKMQQVADEVICSRQAERYSAVGQWYIKFSVTADEEVDELLHRARLVHAALQP